MSGLLRGSTIDIRLLESSSGVNSIGDGKLTVRRCDVAMVVEGRI